MATATFLGTDTAAKGNWVGVYGADGFQIPLVGSITPSYATFGLSGNWANYAWVGEGGTTDPRAPTHGGGDPNARAATTWYGDTQYWFNLDFSDGRSHVISIYALDWDSLGARRFNFSVQDEAATVIDGPRSSGDYSGGIWFRWLISGNVDLVTTFVANINTTTTIVAWDSPFAKTGLL